MFPSDDRLTTVDKSLIIITSRKFCREERWFRYVIEVDHATTDDELARARRRYD